MIHRIKHHVRHHYHRAKHHLRNAFIPHEGNDHRPHALRHKVLTAYAIIVIIVKVVVSGVLLIYPGPSVTSDLTPRIIAELTNDARGKNNLSPLKTNGKLENAAAFKAQDMLAKGYFAHISPQKVTPWFWFKRAGYNYSSAGENLAMDFIAAEDVVEAWLKSPGHRKNLLNAKYRDIGVAVAEGKLNGVSTTLVVQFFGVPVQTRQQPKPVAKVTPEKPKAPVKKSSVAVTTPTPPPPVLGEQVIPPPLTPKITSPASDTVLATSRPWIGGESEPSVTINLFRDGQKVGETASDANGYFQVQPSEDLPDGKHVITTFAVNEGGSSPLSDALNVTIDTLPPSASLSSVVILPSFTQPNGYTVVGTLHGEDIAEAHVRIARANQRLSTTEGPFIAELVPLVGEEATNVEIELKDAIGNVSVVPVASLSFLDAEVIQPAPQGFAQFVPNLLFFSRRFFITFWLFLFLALAVNVIVKIRVQHRPMILYSLLLLYGLTIVLITT